MTFPMPRRGRFAAGLLVMLAALQLAGGVEVAAQSANLVVNPLLTRELTPPGWIGLHRDSWVHDHAAYRATCQNEAVVQETRVLNGVFARDEYLLSLVSAPDAPDATSARLAQAARDTLSSLRSETTVVNELMTQLQALPACETAKPAASPHAGGAVAAATAPSSPPPETTPASQAPETAAALPAPTAPAGARETGDANRVVIRFDDRVAALTPTGIRAFNQAIAAARDGKDVRLAIEGCEAGADFSDGSPCARRLLSLKHRLAAAGIKNPQRLFGDLR